MKFLKLADAMNLIDLLESRFTVENNNAELTGITYDKLICFNKFNDYDNFVKTYKYYKSISNNKILDIAIESYVTDMYLTFNKYNECINEIKSFLSTHTDDKFKELNADLKTNLVTCYRQTKNNDAAMKINAELIKDNPNNIDFHITKAILLSDKYGDNSAHAYLVGLRDKFKNDKELENFIKSFENTGKKYIIPTT